ncbi:DUF2470 domain-containing protein [Streptomyces sp. NPDC006326]|uniref:DUF2470 domain-containing protein n=1 Tax=Streptomyces sp. NPDC006326 TaxID=3156752 RepID=UPI0033BF460C
MSGESAAARAAAHAQDADLTAVIEITDVAPVSVPHRIRGRAWLTGWLTRVRGADLAVYGALLGQRPGRTLLRLEVGEVSVDDLWGAEQVDPEALGAAEPDPLVHHETEILQHLAAAHADRVGDLTALLGRRESAGLSAVPLSLDRLGLRIRFTAPGSAPFDARFDFPVPVRDVCDLRRAMRTLFAAAALQEAPGSGRMS